MEKPSPAKCFAISRRIENAVEYLFVATSGCIVKNANRFRTDIKYSDCSRIQDNRIDIAQ